MSKNKYLIFQNEGKVKAEQANLAAKEFSDIFYENFDKKRNAVKNLYLDTANLIWNGRAVSGKDAIVKFLEDLPTSRISVCSLDTQPVVEASVEGETTIVVTVFGKVQFTGSKAKGFFQTFLLSSRANVWKIVSDNYRFMEINTAS